MSDEEMIEKLTQIVYECQPELTGKKLERDTIINKDLGMDSMNFILVVCKLEAQFGIHIPDEDLMKLSTVQDVLDEIHRLQAAND